MILGPQISAMRLWLIFLFSFFPICVLPGIPDGSIKPLPYHTINCNITFPRENFFKALVFDINKCYDLLQ